MESIKYDTGTGNLYENKAIEIVPKRLYWNSDKKPPKSKDGAFYFCID